MILFSDLGALLTVESEMPFAEAEFQFNSGIFDELMADGHGVSSHCGITPDAPVEPPMVFSDEFAVRKVKMDAVIDAEQYLVCSGRQGRRDWILGAYNAGFKESDVVVSFAYHSLPPEKRPPGLTDEYILLVGPMMTRCPLTSPSAFTSV